MEYQKWLNSIATAVMRLQELLSESTPDVIVADLERIDEDIWALVEWAEEVQNALD